MESLPEDADINQLLALRQQLLQQLNVSDPVAAEAYNARKEIKYRHHEKSEHPPTTSRKTRKRHNSRSPDKSSKRKAVQLHAAECMDRADEKAVCSGIVKRSGKDPGAWVPSASVLISPNAGKCPFQSRPDKSPDVNHQGNKPKELTSHAVIEKSASAEQKRTEVVSTNISGFPPSEAVDADENNQESETSRKEDEIENTSSMQGGNAAAFDGNITWENNVFVPEESISPPSQPLLPPPPSQSLTSADEANSENTNSSSEQQQPEETGQSASLQPDEGTGSGETHENVERSNKDLSLSDEDDDEDIDLLLEKPVEDAQTSKVTLPEGTEVREKIVMVHKNKDYFDVLPEGWLEVTHSSGLPVFLHKSTRVCTFSKPYFIGPGSVRKHKVPLSAIPCLEQRRLRDERKGDVGPSAAAQQKPNTESDAAKGDDGTNEDPALVLARLQAPETKVQTVEDFKQRQLDPETLYDYAKAVFEFHKIQVCRFKKWSETRNFHRQKKLAEAGRLGKTASCIDLSVERPSLPSNVQLITVPALEANLKPQGHGFFLNPRGKTSVSVLHEFVQKVLKSTISYHFTEKRNSRKPYECVARLKINMNSRMLCAASVKERLMLLQEQQKRERLQENGEQPGDDPDFVVLGTGDGVSKKMSKLAAARNALKVLIPHVNFDDTDYTAVNDKKERDDTESDRDDPIALFDMLAIEDTRISELSAKAGQPLPYAVLQECLKRNAAYGDTAIKLQSARVKHQRHQFDMDVGKHRVTVICQNKHDGKQRTSQAMLKKLHPNLDTWGSILRLYGHEAQQKQQEARKSRQSIIKLQGNRDKESSALEPNTAILDKLRAEMLKLAKSKQQIAEETAVPKRPVLSATSDPVDEVESAQKSADYAAAHPDALSALRIDL